MHGRAIMEAETLQIGTVIAKIVLTILQEAVEMTTGALSRLAFLESSIVIGTGLEMAEERVAQGEIAMATAAMGIVIEAKLTVDTVIVIGIGAMVTVEPETAATGIVIEAKLTVDTGIVIVIGAMVTVQLETAATGIVIEAKLTEDTVIVAATTHQTSHVWMSGIPSTLMGFVDPERTITLCLSFSRWRLGRMKQPTCRWSCQL